MHDEIASRGDEKVTHLCEPYLIEGKYKNVKDDVPSHHSFRKRVIVVFGSSKVLDVLTLTEFLRRAHLFFEICADGHSWSDCAGVSNEVDNSRGDCWYLNHWDWYVEGLSKTAVSSLVDVNVLVWSQISDSSGDNLSMGRYRDDKSFDHIWVLTVGVVLHHYS